MNHNLNAINHSFGLGAPGISATPPGPPPRLELRFTVPGPPVPKARARVVGGETGARAFTPTSTVAYEKTVAFAALATRGCLGAWPLDACYGVEIAVYRSAARGDWDNFAKSICDACNGILWADDRQISDGHVILRRAEKGAERVDVRVWTMPVAR